MKKLLATAAFAVSALTGTAAMADYPDGPVQFIVPWPPGDFEDILTRMIADDMAEATGQAVSVVNRPVSGTLFVVILGVIAITLISAFRQRKAQPT